MENLIVPIIAIALLLVIILTLFVIPILMRRQERLHTPSGIRDTGEHPLRRRTDTINRLDLSDVPDMEIDWNAITHRSVRQYLHSNKKEAVNAYRQFTGCGRQDAEKAINYAIQHMESLPHDSHVVNATDLDISLEELMQLRRLVQNGKKHEATRLYCEYTGANMSIGHEAVETIAAQL